MFSKRTLLKSAASLGVATSLPHLAAAQSRYPDRHIRFVIGFPAGSGADVMCRWYARQLEIACKSPVIIENKPGAGANIATVYVARAKPDGYTLSLNSSSSMIGPRFLLKDPGFDPQKDFVPIRTIAQLAFVMVTSPRRKETTLPEVTAVLKTKKNATFGYTNPTSIMCAELYKRATGIEASSVAYKTSPDGLRDVIEGDLDFMFMDSTFAAGQVRSGNLRALAVTSTERVGLLPDAPTMKELNFDVSFAPWWAAWAPHGTPQPIIDQLSKWLEIIAKSDETKEFLEKIAANPLLGGPEETSKRLADEIAIWPPLVAAAQLTPQ